MTGFVGADLAALARVAKKFDDSASRLAEAGADLTSALDRTAWRGSRAEDARATWHRSQVASIDAAVNLLRTTSAGLAFQREEQRAASSSLDGPPHRAAPRRTPGGEGGGTSKPPDLCLPEMTATDGYHLADADDAWPGHTSFPPVKPGQRPWEGISPDDVNQGKIGDCFLMAAFGSLASTEEGRRLLYNCITDNDDGTYTVTFPNGVRSVTISDDFYFQQDGTPAYAGFQGGPAVIWPLILEKAYAAYMAEEYRDGLIELDEGGDPGKVLQLFGSPASKEPISNESFARIAKSQAPAVLSAYVPHEVFPPDSDWRNITSSTWDTNARHAFSVVDSFIASDGTVYLQVRNPWGHNNKVNVPAASPPGFQGGDDGDSGTFWVTAEQATDMFYRLQVGSPK